MLLKKAIIIPPLYLAWIIIFAHSIIPHNHHNESKDECESLCPVNKHNTSDKILLGEFLTDHNDKSENHDHCHFNISTTLTKFVDSAGDFIHTDIFIVPVLAKIQILHVNNYDLQLNQFYLDSLSHRGPPCLS